MKHKTIKEIINDYARAEVHNSLLRCDEYQLPMCKCTINKDTPQEQQYSGVNGITLFKKGFMILHGDNSIDSSNIDFIDVQNFDIEEL